MAGGKLDLCEFGFAHGFVHPHAYRVFISRVRVAEPPLARRRVPLYTILRTRFLLEKDASSDGPCRPWGDRIKERRLELVTSQKVLGLPVGVSTSILSGLETAKYLRDGDAEIDAG